MKFLAYLLPGPLLAPVAVLAQTEATSEAVARVAEATGDSTTLWKLVETGGWAMLPLAAMSVLAVMLIVVFLFTMRRGGILSAKYMNTADVLLKKRDYLGLLAISTRHSESIARVLQRTLDFATKNPNASYDTVREIAETEAGAKAASLQNRVVYLADIGVLAPMIGLFGTVIGIIKSFGAMAGTAQEQTRDVLLAAGVSEALVATAGGLILGILCMAFYAMFRGRAQSLISDLEIATAHVLGLIALNYDRKRGSGAAREHARLDIDDEF
jgi:biopolymer transport protein ExbB